MYILKQLFFSISVNSGFRNIYLHPSITEQEFHRGCPVALVDFILSNSLCTKLEDTSGRSHV